MKTTRYQECNCVSPYEWTARSVVLPDTNTIFVAPICDIHSLCFVNATSEITNTVSIFGINFVRIANNRVHLLILLLQHLQ
jgi:hypothetical protein